MRHSGWLYPFLIVAIILISFWCGAAAPYLSLANPHVDIASLRLHEVDYHMLYPELESKRSFFDTFRWWVEPWRPDTWVGAYWRPLSMQAWWIQFHTFGEDRSFNWMRISLLLAAAFDVLFVSFVRMLTRRRLIAVLALAVFALPAPWIHALSPLAVEPRVWNADLLLFQGWKDQPDLFVNCLTLSAMMLAYLERYGWSLACVALAICFKESGLLALPLIAVLLYTTGRLARVPRWVYGGIAGVLAMMMFARYLAGPLVFRFHTFGEHHAGLTKYILATLPSALTDLSPAAEGVLAVGLFALIVQRVKRPLIWLGAIVGLCLAGVLMTALQFRVPFDVAFAQFALGWQTCVYLLLWLLVFAIAWWQKHWLRWGLIFVACSLVAAIPYGLDTGALDHVLSLARAFQACYGACLSVGVVLGAHRYWRTSIQRQTTASRLATAEA